MVKKNGLLEGVMFPKKQGPFQQLHSPLQIQFLQIYPSADAVITTVGCQVQKLQGAINVSMGCQPHVLWAASKP